MAAELKSRVRDALQKAIKAEQPLAGLVYIAMDRDGKVLVDEAAGRRHATKAQALRSDQYFSLFSATKVITNIA
jgi:hypothetical protein